MFLFLFLFLLSGVVLVVFCAVVASLLCAWRSNFRDVLDILDILDVLDVLDVLQAEAMVVVPSSPCESESKSESESAMTAKSTLAGFMTYYFRKERESNTKCAKSYKLQNKCMVSLTFAVFDGHLSYFKCYASHKIDADADVDVSI